jgi:putative addiction module component (TIGR02574 family)
LGHRLNPANPVHPVKITAGPFEKKRMIASEPEMSYFIKQKKQVEMSPQLIECEAQALKLAPTDRAALAEHLIASFDDLSDEQNQHLWLAEADRRHGEYKSGSLSARSAEDVLNDARATILLKQT